MSIILSALILLVVISGLYAYSIYRRIKRAIESRLLEQNSDVDVKLFRKSLRTSIVNLDALGDVDPSRSDCLKRFEPLRRNSNCLFAKHSKLWGCENWNDDMSIEENVDINMVALEVFTNAGRGLHLDGFLFELPGAAYGTSPAVFGEAVRRVLTRINPDAMNPVRVGKKGWYFEMFGESFFVTTFAPFYDVQHSRYAFGLNGCYILLQPDYSFAWHDIGEDSKNTEWDNPETMRDKIRVEFKKHGRQYYIPPTVSYAQAPFIVKQLKDDDPVIEWWARHPS